MSPRPTHCVVDSSGVAVSQHISLERAEAAARARTARSRRGERYQVRAITRRELAAALEPTPPGARPRADQAANVMLRVRVTPEERARIEGLAAREGLSVSEFIRRRALG